MRVLLFESDHGAADRAAAELVAAGHTVLRCHDRHGPAFPCLGLSGAMACPLDPVGPTADVALVVRRRPWPRPTRLEQGVICALRDGVPLVVAGNLSLNPYDQLCSAVVEGTNDVVTACEQVTGRSADGA